MLYQGKYLRESKTKPAWWHLLPSQNGSSTSQAAWRTFSRSMGGSLGTSGSGAGGSTTEAGPAAGLGGGAGRAASAAPPGGAASVSIGTGPLQETSSTIRATTCFVSVLLI